MVTKTKKKIMSRLQGKVKGRAKGIALQHKSSEFVWFYTSSFLSSTSVSFSAFYLNLYLYLIFSSFFNFIVLYAPLSSLLQSLFLFIFSHFLFLFIFSFFFLFVFYFYSFIFHLISAEHYCMNPLSDVIRFYRTFLLIIWTFSTAHRKIAYANKTGRGVPEADEEEDEDAGEEEDDEEVRQLYSHSNNHCHYSFMILKLKKSRVF
jgi:hypothetical protein